VLNGLRVATVFSEAESWRSLGFARDEPNRFPLWLLLCEVDG
jgi:hypothetical protein